VRFQAGQMIAASWRQLGLQVDVQGLDFNTLTAATSRPPFNFDAFISGYVARPERLDPDVLLFRPFDSSGIATGTNNFGYHSAQFDHVIEMQRTVTTFKTRRNLVYQAQQILAHDVPATALYYVKTVMAYNKQTFSKAVPVLGQGLWNYWNMISMTPRRSQKYIRMGQTWDMDSWNPFAAVNGIDTLRLIYDTLARVGVNGQPVPSAAQSWKYTNNKTLHVTIRRGMKFSDGTPVTTADVKYSFDIMRSSQGNAIYQPFLESIASIDTAPKNQVVFHLKQPYAPLISAAFTQVLILPKHVWSKVDGQLSKFQNSSPVGSGPFTLNYYRPGQEWKLDANQSYYRKPKAAGIIQVILANPNAIFAALQSGDIDMHDRRLLPDQVPQAQHSGNLQTVTVSDYGVYYVGFNLRKAPFINPYLRKAATLAVDKKAIVRTLLAGYATPGQGFIAPANKPWYNPHQDTYPYSMTKARQMLRKGGFEFGSDGRLYYPAK